MSEPKVNYGKYEEKYGAYSSIGFFPIKDQVIILPLKVLPLPRKSDIILANTVSDDSKKQFETYDKYPLQGIVVAVGPGFDSTRPTMVRPGMRVCMNIKWDIDSNGQLMAARAFLFNKMMYYKCQEGNILGIVEGDIDDPRKDIPLSPLTKE